MNAEVDNYLLVGCGRCPLGGTPQCKVHSWENELETLRMIVLSTPLKEEVKWSVPCYTYEGKNVSIMAAFKNYAALSFFKGVLLKDDKKVFSKSSENSQSDRFIKFTTVKEIIKLEPVIKAYIHEAIEIEKAGLKVDFKQKFSLSFPQELIEKFEVDPVFKEAFFALTPGRQRGYSLYFSKPKQALTRKGLIEKSISRILEGKGWSEYG